MKFFNQKRIIFVICFVIASFSFVYYLCITKNQDDKNKIASGKVKETNESSFSVTENYDISSENFMASTIASEISEYDFWVNENLEKVDSKKNIQGNYEITQSLFNDRDGCWGPFLGRIIIKNNSTFAKYIFTASNEEIYPNITPFKDIIMIRDFCKSCGCASDFYIYLMMESGVYRIAYETNNLNMPKCIESEESTSYTYKLQRENRYNLADKIIYSYIKRPKCDESKHLLDNPILEEAFVVIKINPRFPEIFRFYNQGIPAKYRDEWELAEGEK